MSEPENDTEQLLDVTPQVATPLDFATALQTLGYTGPICWTQSAADENMDRRERVMIPIDAGLKATRHSDGHVCGVALTWEETGSGWVTCEAAGWEFKLYSFRDWGHALQGVRTILSEYGQPIH